MKKVPYLFGETLDLWLAIIPPKQNFGGIMIVNPRVLLCASSIILSFAHRSVAIAQDEGLIRTLMRRSKITETQAKEHIMTVFDALKTELKNGRQVEIDNFGVFSVRSRAVRRNSKKPKSAPELTRETRRYVRFSSSAGLKYDLNK